MTTLTLDALVHLDEPAERLNRTGLSNGNHEQLYRHRDLDRVDPEIVGTVSPQLRAMLPPAGADPEIVRSLTAQSHARPLWLAAWSRHRADSGDGVSRISAATRSSIAPSGCQRR